jgi:hypothetical protein
MTIAADILRQKAAEYLALGIAACSHLQRTTADPLAAVPAPPTGDRRNRAVAWEAADGLGLVLGHPNPHGKYWWALGYRSTVPGPS